AYDDGHVLDWGSALPLWVVQQRAGCPLAPQARRLCYKFDTLLISSKNLSRSTLPPETTATIGPLPALPLNAAATDNAPAPSAITRLFSASNRIACLVSSRLTTIEPSATGRIRSHIRGKIFLPPAPSTNDCFHPVKACGDCFANDNAPGAAVSGSAPQTF